MRELEHSRPADIEAESFRIIGAELAERGIVLPADQAPLVKRAIHTTADFDYARNLVFTPGAVEAGVRALRAGTPILTDTNMARSGINRGANTLNKEMFYYAVKLENGDILRVSKTVDTAFRTAMKVFPVMGLIAVIMLAFASALVKWQVTRLIRPINRLDLENPLENDVYEELTPLLQSIDKQNKEKDAVANMRKEFSANVSHELKTPLTSISGYAEIMKNGLVKPEDMTGFAERIYNEASRLITLVEDIIKLSKLDEGNVELEKEEVDLYKLTREILTRLSPQAAKRKVHVEVTGEPVEYVGIRQILDEMIYNICENAIKYNKEGGKLTVWVGNTLQGKKICVTDTGIGIPENETDRIFERFYRVDKSHSKETGGTGLGLSIVKHGAMLHGAKIHVDSKLGEGTKIELIF